MQGKGAVFTVDAPRTATYRLDLYSLGKDFPARLEDADGWPLTPPGPLATLEQKIEKGRYRRRASRRNGCARCGALQRSRRRGRAARSWSARAPF
ncbi:protein of unknown function [Methylocella tundrae]|uniref:Uncharacterized protein n=1 Tax=Methylocella tundrae TaxID=227605 RepID=A0A4U8Z046_METTU|nr:protein of unknown function [Methylocella tundrae]